MSNKMQFASAITTIQDVTEATQILTEQITRQMDGLSIDLVLVFLSPHFRTTASQLSEALREQLNPRVLLGSTAEGVIGPNQEIEQASAISLIAAHLPYINLAPFLMQTPNWQPLLNNPNIFQEHINAPPQTKLFLLLADPFSTPVDKVLTAFNNFFTGFPVIGGMASGSVRPGGNVLLLNEQTVTAGAVGVAIAGAIDVDVIVSQGCKPVGHSLTVTHARENLIFTIEDEAPLDHIQKMVSALPDADREKLSSGLFIGRAINTDQDVPGRGDFLVRSVMGIEETTGAMVVGDYIKNNETIQFHIRDASTAEEDLEMMLAPQLFYDPPCGGLLFSCNGRGTRLYGHPDGDISTIQKIVGNINMAGFFCAGEIGPIGNKNFLHGHTASLVLFRPADNPV